MICGKSIYKAQKSLGIIPINDDNNVDGDV